MHENIIFTSQQIFPVQIFSGVKRPHELRFFEIEGSINELTVLLLLKFIQTILIELYVYSPVGKEYAHMHLGKKIASIQMNKITYTTALLQTIPPFSKLNLSGLCPIVRSSTACQFETKEGSTFTVSWKKIRCILLHMFSVRNINLSFHLNNHNITDLKDAVIAVISHENHSIVTSKAYNLENCL